MYSICMIHILENKGKMVASHTTCKKLLFLSKTDAQTCKDHLSYFSVYQYLPQHYSHWFLNCFSFLSSTLEFIQELEEKKTLAFSQGYRSSFENIRIIFRETLTKRWNGGESYSFKPFVPNCYFNPLHVYLELTSSISGFKWDRLSSDSLILDIFKWKQVPGVYEWNLFQVTLIMIAHLSTNTGCDQSFMKHSK